MAGCVRFAASHYGTCGNVLSFDARSQAFTYVIDLIQRRSTDIVTPNLPVGFSKSFAGGAYTSPAEIFINENGYPNHRSIADFTGNNYFGGYVTTDVRDGLPRRYVFRHDGSGGIAGCRMYINGVLQTLTSEGKTLTSSTATSDALYIGNQQGFTSTFYTDFQRGPYTWLSDKGDAWAVAAGDYGSPLPDPTGAYIALPLNDGSGTTAADLSGNARNCTLSSSGLWVPFEFGISVTNRRLQGPAPTNSTNSASAVTRTFASNITSGSLIVVGVGNLNTGGTTTVTVTDSLGNTYTKVGGYVTNNNTKVSIWRTVSASGGANTVTVTPSAAAYLDVKVVEVSGNWPATPEETATTATGSSSTPSLGSITPAGPGRFIFGMVVSNGGTRAGGYSNSCVGEGVTTQTGVTAAFQQAFADGATSFNFTDSQPLGGAKDWSAVDWSAVAVPFKPDTSLPIWRQSNVKAYQQAVTRASRI